MGYSKLLQESAVCSQCGGAIKDGVCAECGYGKKGSKKMKKESLWDSLPGLSEKFKKKAMGKKDDEDEEDDEEEEEPEGKTKSKKKPILLNKKENKKEESSDDKKKKRTAADYDPEQNERRRGVVTAAGQSIEREFKSAELRHKKQQREVKRYSKLWSKAS